MFAFFNKESVKKEIKRIMDKLQGALLKASKKISEKISDTADRLKNKNYSRKKLLLNYVAPVAMVAVLFATVGVCVNKNYALAVKYDGEHMAVVENEAVLERANEILNDARAIPEESAAAPVTYELSSSLSEDTSAEALYSKLLDMDAGLAGDAVGLYIDGKFIGAAEDEQSVRDALSNRLKNIKAQGYDSVVYNNTIEYAGGVYPTSVLYGTEELVRIAAESLDVAYIKSEVTSREVDFATQYLEDSSIYEGREKVSVEGSKGQEKVTTRYTYVDSVLVNTQIISVERTVEPVDRVILVGTKVIPDKGVGSGSYIWPCPSVTMVTSEYGYRWGKLHKGIDIAGGYCYGAEIVAADGGIVTWSGYDNSGYGYYVVIDHGNGMETLYAHCSELYVSQGEQVGKGQPIAAIGNSGNSDGAHLHFEVHIGGSPVDPRGYI